MPDKKRFIGLMGLFNMLMIALTLGLGPRVLAAVPTGCCQCGSIGAFCCTNCTSGDCYGRPSCGQNKDCWSDPCGTPQ